jgi:hypothetical protein
VLVSVGAPASEAFRHSIWSKIVIPTLGRLLVPEQRPAGTRRDQVARCDEKQPLDRRWQADAGRGGGTSGNQFARTEPGEQRGNGCGRGTAVGRLTDDRREGLREGRAVLKLTCEN